ncbi:MAG: hypothetical protein FWF28_04195, partial [Micrococcales bacterium]|nr:hypothetical protein [Micrococcales bacterium]
SVMTIQVVAPAETDRAWNVAQAAHSIEMEGLHVSTASMADAEEYVAGRIDIDEFGARVRARYGVA